MLDIMNLLPSGIANSLRFAKRSPRVFREYYTDACSYIKHSSIVDYRDKEKLFSLITATYHNIEKGLSLTKPKLGFGKQNINRLISYIHEYQENFGSSPLLDTPINVLKSYCEFNNKHGADVSWLDADLQQIIDFNKTASPENDKRGGVLKRTKNQVSTIVSQVPEDFFYLRHSIRQFTQEPVSMSAVEVAVRVAQKSPVVCNRQSGRVYGVFDKRKIIQTLEIQGGARGFLNEVTALFCIVVDTRSFNGSGERNQGWIDGGMFAMSFILGLHQQGLGACCLNWSKDKKDNLIMKKFLGIPDYEQIIMFVAAGNLKDEFNVAESVRKPLDSVFRELS